MNERETVVDSHLVAREEDVTRHSRVLHKELGLRDLVLTQILFVVGLSWVGAAAKLGPSHVIFWLLAIALFYIPSAIVVIYLNRLMPLEGGLYQWAKLGFNEATGFLVAWNLWLFAMTNTSEAGLQLATNIAYALGPSGAWIASNKPIITLASAGVVALLVYVSMVGLSLGKWVHNAGGAIMLAVFAALIVLPFIGVARGTLPHYRPLATAVPIVSLFSLNILGKLGFGALGGFEYVAILAGECRSPARTIGRSVMIAAPAIALMFIFGTSSVLALVPNEQIDLIAPIPQTLSIGFAPFGLGALIVPVALVLLMTLRVAQASVNFTATSRLPMVAGWDHLLPQWFTRLHLRRKTPVNSIILVGAITLTLGLLSLIGVGNQEAFQLLFNAGGIFYALTYVVMFAIPLFGLRAMTPAPPWWLRVASASGLVMTVLYVCLSIFPIIEVKSTPAFTAKVAALIVLTNLIGATIFFVAKRRQKLGRAGFEPAKA
jgi:amino acid transporter